MTVSNYRLPELIGGPNNRVQFYPMKTPIPESVNRVLELWTFVEWWRERDEMGFPTGYWISISGRILNPDFGWADLDSFECDILVKPKQEPKKVSHKKEKF